MILRHHSIGIYATYGTLASRDGWTWVEDKVPAVKRLPKPQNGWRSISTLDILIWNKKYYLYYQAFNEIPGKNVADRAAVTVAESDSPYGPWKPSGKMIINFGKSADWDSNAIHDPYPIVYKNKIYLYYKGSPQKKVGLMELSFVRKG